MLQTQQRGHLMHQQQQPHTRVFIHTVIIDYLVFSFFFFLRSKHVVHIQTAHRSLKDPDKSLSLGGCDRNRAPVASEHFIWVLC